MSPDVRYFGCGLTLDEHQKLNVISEYNSRTMNKQFKHWIKVEYEEMKRNLND